MRTWRRRSRANGCPGSACEKRCGVRKVKLDGKHHHREADGGRAKHAPPKRDEERPKYGKPLVRKMRTKESLQGRSEQQACDQECGGDSPSYWAMTLRPPLPEAA